MNKNILLKLSIFMLFISGLTIAIAQSHTEKEVKAQTPRNTMSLPASLDNFFPPGAEQPVYLFKMLELGRSFSGMMVDLSEDDVENALSHFEKFRVQYNEVSKLVPEWEHYYSPVPVNELGKALKDGDPAIVMQAGQKVGGICAGCHGAFMSQAYYKYHWGNFHGIKIQDPVRQQEVSFQQFMLFLENSFTGITIDLEQGQAENARMHLQHFRDRFDVLEESCMNCHDSERYYFVDENVKNMIDKLGQVLSTSPVDPEEIGTISKGIGMESCFKCHLVHVPAASAQMQMIKYQKSKH